MGACATLQRAFTQTSLSHGDAGSHRSCENAGRANRTLHQKHLHPTSRYLSGPLFFSTKITLQLPDNFANDHDKEDHCCRIEKQLERKVHYPTPLTACSVVGPLKTAGLLS